jgi:uncharacterized lipoprotein
MSRTVLTAAAAVLIGLAACGGGKHSAKPAATRSKSTATPATSTQKKKTTAKPDTTRQKNPLTNN